MSNLLAAAGAGLGLIGDGVGARGARESGRAAQQAAGFNREIGVINATQALQSSGASVDRLRYAGARLRGAQRAGYGAAGIDLASGTPQDVYADTAEQLKLAERVKFYEGELSATEAMNRAQIAALTGEAASTAASCQAGASLLGGAGHALGWISIFGGSDPAAAGQGLDGPPGTGTGGLY
ncbi:MAG: hypothetical protein AB7H90_24005 [Alphaproteobacteria bacterium]